MLGPGLRAGELTEVVPELEVEEGQIVLSSITKLADHEDVKVWLIDCSSKYPDVVQVSGGHHAGVHLWKGDRTLRAVESTKPTSVSFPCPEGWSCFVDGGRYSVFVCLFDTAGGMRAKSAWPKGD